MSRVGQNRHVRSKLETFFHVADMSPTCCRHSQLSRCQRGTLFLTSSGRHHQLSEYLRPCLEIRKDFTPLVYSVDGITGREAKNAEKRLDHLSEKWHKQLPQMVYYVQIRMAIAVVRANSLLIRGSRDRQRPRCPVISDWHVMNNWRTWSEQ